MEKKLGYFFREYKLVLSSILTGIGLIMFIFGALGAWTTVLVDSSMITSDIANWSFYIFIIGGIILLTGIYYLYEYIKNKRFFMEEININKRSEFVKKHQELKYAVKRLPEKYHIILQEKENELKIR